METAFLLILLTLNSAGQTVASFVNTDTLEACQGKIRVLSKILTGGGVNIIETRCVPSTLKFTKFSHGGRADTKRQTYHVMLGKTKARVTTTSGMETCKNLKIVWKGAEVVKTYCATSTQTPLGPVSN